MGFEENVALKASQVCKDINTAIEWIFVNNTSEEKKKNVPNMLANDHCNGSNINNCVALNRIISILKFYQANHQNYHELIKHIQTYSKHP